MTIRFGGGCCCSSNCTAHYDNFDGGIRDEDGINIVGQSVYSFPSGQWAIYHDGHYGYLKCLHDNSEFKFVHNRTRLLTPKVNTTFTSTTDWAEIRLKDGISNDITLNVVLEAASSPTFSYNYDIVYSLTHNAGTKQHREKIYINPSSFSQSFDMYIYLYPHTRFSSIEDIFYPSLENFIKYDPGCHYLATTLNNGWQTYALSASYGVKFDELQLIRPLKDCYTVTPNCQLLCYDQMPSQLVLNLSGLENSHIICQLSSSDACEYICETNRINCMTDCDPCSAEQTCECSKLSDECNINCQKNAWQTMVFAPCAELNGSIVLDKFFGSGDPPYGSKCSDPYNGCLYKGVFSSSGVGTGYSSCVPHSATQEVRAYVKSMYYDEDLGIHYTRIEMNNILGYAGNGGGVWTETVPASQLCNGDPISFSWGNYDPSPPKPKANQLLCFGASSGMSSGISPCSDSLDVGYDPFIWYCKNNNDCSATITEVIESSQPASDAEVNLDTVRAGF